MQVGSCTLVLSNMYGGKTSYIMHLIETYGRATRCLYINHSKDNRSTEPFSTHNLILDISSLSVKLNADMIKISRLSQIPDSVIENYQIIFIDEAQFFEDLNERIRFWVDFLGAETYVVGLNGDFNRDNFGQIHLLLPFVDDIVVLRDTLCAVCSSQGHRVPALFSKNLENATDEQIQIGGAGKYIPVCRKCYLN